MNEGMGALFTGDFNGPLAARDWKDTRRTQANVETVERSGIDILVVSLAGYPVLRCSPRDAVRRQVALAERFVTEHPEWLIARSPEEARAGLAQHRRVLVLALEPNILENDADIDEFVDRLGVRIVTFLHISDDDNGGAALLPGAKAATTPGTLLFHSHRDPEDHVLRNSHGLTDRGRALAHKLIDRGVWIDVAHASDESARELIAMDETAGLPVLITHTTLRRYLRAERAAPEWELEAVARSGGVVGLVPSEEMLEGTVLPAGACGAGCDQPCQGGIHALAQQWRDVAALVPSAAIALGSDYSDGISHLHPACPVGTELDAAGLWNIGQAGAVWTSLEKLGAPVARPRAAILDHFLEAWSRVTHFPSRPPPPREAPAAAR
jgi:microsomal dipeptidase-like Zn-dependent dipeptidase